MNANEPRTVNAIRAEDLTEPQKKALEWHGKGFDNRTHIMCPSTGKLIRMQNYRYVVDHEKGTHYIRDGKRWSEQGICLDPEPVAAQAKEMGPKNDKKLSQ